MIGSVCALSDVSKQFWLGGVFDVTGTVVRIRVVVLVTSLGGLGDEGCVSALGWVEYVLIALHRGRNSRDDGR